MERSRREEKGGRGRGQLSNINFASLMMQRQYPRLKWLSLFPLHFFSILLCLRGVKNRMYVVDYALCFSSLFTDL